MTDGRICLSNDAVEQARAAAVPAKEGDDAPRRG
jgi:hypothetical protein